MALQADDLLIYLSREIWNSLKPDQDRLLIAVSGYGRFWLYLEPKPPQAG